MVKPSLITEVNINSVVKGKLIEGRGGGARWLAGADIHTCM